ncbi:uncharacterized protein FSUBG_4215 [Fusarium subglutinans]|uniref:Uncharacterized protein n=1 Tax=Gibberella subglutinans TaxID=42677 RepID=A0A8H5Q5B2_GIBSU|nr:uncharacterized protein FSUBG_4215 [Fusarium subglutinans]KAF5609060.1 hypothetical protein FSUBG_4215 [Fusarium subglutinans]
MSAPSSNDLPQKSPRPSTELKPMPDQKEKTREEELAREREATRAIQIALAIELSRGGASRPVRIDMFSDQRRAKRKISSKFLSMTYVILTCPNKYRNPILRAVIIGVETTNSFYLL